ncbi:MAG: hypothetical protein OEY20_02235 [Gemmatimonadota bacterium]|nr:hypothetical protein [Gemmatimonadota bacterium]
MDVIGKRVKARNLEVEGKLREALDVYRDILAHEPTSEQFLPIAVQASELSVMLGDREAGVAMLLAAADRYAEAGHGWQVIDLHQRIRRLDPSRKGVDLRLARRMLERRHPQAAREFLADLARRFKKEKLRQVLAKMEDWSDDEVQRRLLAFLDRAEGIRDSTTAVHAAGAAHAVPAPSSPPPADSARTTVPVRAAPPVRESVPPPPPPVAPPPTVHGSPTVPPAPPKRPYSNPPVAVESPVDRATGPRRAPRDSASPPALATTAESAAEPARTAPVPERPRIPSESIAFVTPDVHEPASAPETRNRRFGDRRRKPSRLPSVVLATVVIAVAGGGGLLLGMRLGGGLGETNGAARQPASIPVESLPVVAQPDSGARAGDEPATPDDQGPVAAAIVAQAATGQPAPDRQPESSVPVRPNPPAPAPPATDTALTAPQQRPAPGSTPPPAVARQEPSSPPAREVVQASPPAPAPPPVAPPFGAEYPFVIVEGLAIADIAEQGTGTARRVVVKQVLPSGDTLALSASDLGASSVGLGSGRLLVSRHPSGGAMGTVRVGQHLVSARASVAPEVLEPFLRKLVEVVRE